MEFFDKVKKTAISVAKVSSRESKKLYSITRLSLEITENQNKIKALYKEIGMDAYKAHIENADIAECIRAKLGRIDALEEKIAAIRMKIETIKATDELGVDESDNEEVEIQDAEIVEEDVETEPIDPIE